MPRELYFGITLWMVVCYPYQTYLWMVISISQSPPLKFGVLKQGLTPWIITSPSLLQVTIWLISPWTILAQLGGMVIWGMQALAKDLTGSYYMTISSLALPAIELGLLLQMSLTITLSVWNGAQYLPLNVISLNLIDLGSWKMTSLLWLLHVGWLPWPQVLLIIWTLSLLNWVDSRIQWKAGKGRKKVKGNNWF